MTKKVMKLIDQNTGLMVCKVCGSKHFANKQSGTERKDGKTTFCRGAWQCINCCTLAESNREKILKSYLG
jgi:hypothetical protein